MLNHTAWAMFQALFWGVGRPRIVAISAFPMFPSLPVFAVRDQSSIQTYIQMSALSHTARFLKCNAWEESDDDDNL